MGLNNQIFLENAKILYLACHVIKNNQACPTGINKNNASGFCTVGACFCQRFWHDANIFSLLKTSALTPEDENNNWWSIDDLSQTIFPGYPFCLILKFMQSSKCHFIAMWLKTPNVFHAQKSKDHAWKLNIFYDPWNRRKKNRLSVCSVKAHF